MLKKNHYDQKITYLLLSLWNILNNSKKKQYFLLIILIILGSSIEIIAIGSILPLIQGINSPITFYHLYLANTPISNFISTDSQSITIFLGSTFALISIISSSLKIGIIWYTSKIAFTTGADITNLIFHKINSKNYDYHQNVKTNEVINAISIKVNSLINSVIIPCLYLINSIVMTAVIVFCLMYIDLEVALTIFICYIIAYTLILIVSKKKLNNNSLTIAKNSSELIKLTQIVLGGAKNIIIDKTALYFNELFNQNNSSLRLSQSSSVFIANSPKNILEALGIMLIVFIAIKKISNNEEMSLIIAKLGVVTLCAQRLLPLMQNAYSSWTSLRENKHSIFDLFYIIQDNNAFDSNSSPIFFNQTLELKNISFKYNSSQQETIKDFNLKITRGDKIAIVGATGSGKSTIINIILGLLKHSNGIILADEKVASLYNNIHWHSMIGNVPQDIYLYDGSIKENILFGINLDKINSEKLKFVSEVSLVTEFSELLPNGINSMVGEYGSLLSGGQKQRVGIARALYKSPKILILDEALSGLDLSTEEKILDNIILNFPDLTIISITHNNQTLYKYDKVIDVKKYTDVSYN